MNSVVIHSTALTNISNQPVLREGSSVYVRILKQTGPQSFEAVFSGRKFNVQSEIPLQPGKSFRAEVKLLNGQVQLVPAQESAVASVNEGIQESPAGSQFFNLLSNLGLVPDSVSMASFNQMKNLGMKFDLALFNKVRNLALKFPGKESKAASLAMILVSKGIEVDESSLSEYFGILGEEFVSENQSNHHFSGKKSSEKSPDYGTLLKSFLKKVFEGKESGNEGFLSVFNHKGFKAGGFSVRGNWITVPFEFTFEKKNRTEGGNGFINLLFEEKKLKNCFVKFNFPDNEYKFSIGFEGKKAVSFSVFETAGIFDDFSASIKEKLFSLNLCGKDLEIRRREEDFFSDFETDLKEYSGINQEA